MIYFIRSPEGPIKIGTTTQLGERLKQLTLERGPGLQVLGVTEGGRSEEKVLHRRFERWKVRPTHQCEWFNPSEDLDCFIATETRPWKASDDEPGTRHNYEAFLEAVHRKSHIPKATIIRLAVAEWCERNGYGTPPEL